MAFDPLKYAWDHCNPRVPFPASLDDGRTGLPTDDAEADPKKAADARERKNLEARKRRGGGRGPDIVLKRKPGVASQFHFNSKRRAPSAPVAPASPTA